MNFVNQTFRNRDLMGIRGVYLGFVRTVAFKTQIEKKHLNCVLNYKMGEAYKDKNYKIMVSYRSCLSRIVIEAGKK